MSGRAYRGWVTTGFGYDSVVNPNDFLRLVLDPIRLSLLGAAASGSLDIDRTVEEHDADRRTVLEAYGRLRAAGLILDDDGLAVDRLQELAASLPSQPIADPEIVAGEWSQEERDVLARFFSGTRLESIPTQHAKRLVVLERLAQEFEPGLRYREQEVNFTLQLFHADYAALRRYLVDEGYLTRADGVYWRTGGRT
ncbi:MAG: DUF2087 domain-containing protein [Acidimicrobiia bacterium]|nr:DUF2087 domain-containing protein [Acidimicrobiia bacterium]